MAKQSRADRVRRLESGACPVHGIGMDQTGLQGEGSARLFIAECPRRDCNIDGTTSEVHGPLTLSATHMHLIDRHGAVRPEGDR